MLPLVDAALTNAVVVVPLALLAAVASLARRPALTHALGLLALLRRFAPPLVQVPLPAWPSSQPRAVVPEAAVVVGWTAGVIDAVDGGSVATAPRDTAGQPAPDSEARPARAQDADEPAP